MQMAVIYDDLRKIQYTKLSGMSSHPRISVLVVSLVVVLSSNSSDAVCASFVVVVASWAVVLVAVAVELLLSSLSLWSLWSFSSFLSFPIFVILVIFAFAVCPRFVGAMADFTQQGIPVLRVTFFFVANVVVRPNSRPPRRRLGCCRTVRRLSSFALSCSCLCPHFM